MELDGEVVMSEAEMEMVKLRLDPVKVRVPPDVALLLVTLTVWELVALVPVLMAVPSDLVQV